MPRASSVDPCLLCGQLPCACVSTRPKAKAKPRARKVASEQVISAEPAVTVAPQPAPSRQSMVERMRARAAAAPPLPPPVVREVPRRARPTAEHARPKPLSVEDAETLKAVRVLSDAFEIHPDDLKRWKPYLDQPETPQERAAQWRKRRERNEAQS